MSRKPQTLVQCDICKHPAKALDPQQMKADCWVSINVESYYTDRCWNDYDICPDCARKVYDAYSRTMKPAKDSP